MADTKAKRFFRETDYPEYWTQKVRALYEDVLLDYFVESLEIKRGEKVLEVGTGEGRLIPKVVEKGASYVGIDISDRMLRKAEDRVSKSIQRFVDLVVSDAEHLPFRDNYFDKVFCFATFFFIPNKGGALEEISRVTRGIVMIDFRNALNPEEFRTYILHQALARSQGAIRFVLNQPSFKRILVRLFGTHRVGRVENMLSYGLAQPYYLTTPFELNSLFRRAGMQISYIKGISSPKLKYSRGKYRLATQEIKLGTKWIKPVLIVKAFCQHKKV